MRIGMGYDVHRLVEGRRLILGGVEIPYEKGLLGHSDADVLLHAVMDALLGAAALGIFLDALGEGHARGGVALRAVAAAVDGEVLELDLTGPAAGQGVVSLPAAGLAALWEIHRARK